MEPRSLGNPSFTSTGAGDEVGRNASHLARPARLLPSPTRHSFASCYDMTRAIFAAQALIYRVRQEGRKLCSPLGALTESRSCRVQVKVKS